MTTVSTPKKLLHASTLLTKEEAIAFLDSCLEFSNTNLRHRRYLDFVPITHVEGYGDRYALGILIGELIDDVMGYYLHLVELGVIHEPDPFEEAQQ